MAHVFLENMRSPLNLLVTSLIGAILSEQILHLRRPVTLFHTFACTAQSNDTLVVGVQKNGATKINLSLRTGNRRPLNSEKLGHANLQSNAPVTRHM